jgi:hypothetical protein
VSRVGRYASLAERADFAGDDRERASRQSLAALDGRLARLTEKLERLSRELAEAEERLNGRPSPERPTEPGAAREPGRGSGSEGAHLLFVPRPNGYTLLARAGRAPGPGTEVELPEEGGCFVVTKLGPAPLPSDGRRCAYLVER